MELIDECPRAEAPRITTPVKTLHRVCVKLGGMGKLAQRLGVTRRQLAKWLTGREEIPTHIFLRAVDLLAAYGD